jgi:hypothetical protein
LIEDGQKPVTVGLWFSLGHSTVVIMTCVVIAASSAALADRFDHFQTAGGIIGTSISMVNSPITSIEQNSAFFSVLRLNHPDHYVDSILGFLALDWRCKFLHTLQVDRSFASSIGTTAVSEETS